MSQVISLKAPTPRQFSGRVSTGEGLARFFLLIALGLPIILVNLGRLGAGQWLICLGVIAFLCQGSRWRVTISPDGVVLRRWIAWVVPLRARRFLLDASPKDFWAWDSDYAEGLEIEDFAAEAKSSETFGPDGKSPDHLALWEAIQAAIEEARRYIEQKESHAQPRLRHWLFKEESAFDMGSLTWNPSGGGHPLHRNRVHEIRSSKDVKIDDILIPAGSGFRFNGCLRADLKAWMDPRRSDQLGEITCRAPTGNPHLGESSAASVLKFVGGRLFALQEAQGSSFQVQGFVIDGTKPIYFHRGRSPGSFSLLSLAPWLAIKCLWGAR